MCSPYIIPNTKSASGSMWIIGHSVCIEVVFTKYCCFIRFCDKQAMPKHNKQQEGSTRSTFVPDKNNIKGNKEHEQAASSPSLYQVWSNFVKALDKNGAGFQHL